MASQICSFCPYEFPKFEESCNFRFAIAGFIHCFRSSLSMTFFSEYNDVSSSLSHSDVFDHTFRNMIGSYYCSKQNFRNHCFSSCFFSFFSGICDQFGAEIPSGQKGVLSKKRSSDLKSLMFVNNSRVYFVWAEMQNFQKFSRLPVSKGWFCWILIMMVILELSLKELQLQLRLLFTELHQFFCSHHSSTLSITYPFNKPANHKRITSKSHASRALLTCSYASDMGRQMCCVTVMLM